MYKWLLLNRNKNIFSSCSQIKFGGFLYIYNKYAASIQFTHKSHFLIRFINLVEIWCKNLLGGLEKNFQYFYKMRKEENYYSRGQVFWLQRIFLYLYIFSSPRRYKMYPISIKLPFSIYIIIQLNLSFLVCHTSTNFHFT